MEAHDREGQEKGEGQGTKGAQLGGRSERRCTTRGEKSDSRMILKIHYYLTLWEQRRGRVLLMIVAVPSASKSRKFLGN